MDRRMMNAWLQSQSQKAQITEAQIQRKRLGVVPEAEARNKAGECATSASTPKKQIALDEQSKDEMDINKASLDRIRAEKSKSIQDEQNSTREETLKKLKNKSTPKINYDVGLNEQLNSEEEAYAKEHKSMLKSMVDQYGQEKGTRVFYATVRNKVRGK